MRCSQQHPAPTTESSTLTSAESTWLTALWSRLSSGSSEPPTHRPGPRSREWSSIRYIHYSQWATVWFDLKVRRLLFIIQPNTETSLMYWWDGDLAPSVCLLSQLLKPDEDSTSTQRYIDSRTVQPKAKGAWISTEVTETVKDWVSEPGELHHQRVVTSLHCDPYISVCTSLSLLPSHRE